jgi:hypothetical protein
MSRPRPSDADLAAEVTRLAPPPPSPAEPSDAASSEFPSSAGESPVEGGLPLATAAQLIATVEKLMERVDRGEQGSMELLREILQQNSGHLKQFLSPENRLHPDISDYNPDGERDHPRPRLRRPCYFLGIPLDQVALTKDEIVLLNSVTHPLEIKQKNWRIAFLRDGGGGEALYISVPFNSFDDIRGLEGGWQRVTRELLGLGSKPVDQDLLLERLEKMEALLARVPPELLTDPS